MSGKRAQKGLTLIELSLVLVVLGLVAALLVTLIPSLTRLASIESAVDDVARTQDTLAGFILASGRLPCADTDMDGREDCPAVAGGLPYLTLGLGGPLRNAHGHDYRYGVYARGDGVAMNDARLTSLGDRWEPLMVSGLPPVAALTAFGASNHLDACRSLGVAQAGVVNTGYVHVVHQGAREHVAYVLVDPGQADSDGNGSLFDGLNADGVGFEHPVRAISRGYDDRASVVRFKQLWERLGCSALLATAGHAHPNVASTLAMFRQTIRDYRDQLELVEEMAFADNFQTGASIASALASVAAAAASAPVATASAINTAGATAAAVGASVGAIAGNTALVGTATAAQVVAVINLEKVRDQLDELDELIDELDRLYDSVGDHVVDADTDALSAQ